MAKIFTILLIFLGINQAFSQALNDLNQEQKSRAKSLFKEVRCPVCAGQVIDESDTQIAIDLKQLIITQIKENNSDWQIKANLIKQFGPQILNNPPINKSTIAIWLIPIILLFGIVFYLITAHRFT